MRRAGGGECGGDGAGGAAGCEGEGADEGEGGGDEGGGEGGGRQTRKKRRGWGRRCGGGDGDGGDGLRDSEVGGGEGDGGVDDGEPTAAVTRARAAEAKAAAVASEELLATQDTQLCVSRSARLGLLLHILGRILRRIQGGFRRSYAASPTD